MSTELDVVEVWCVTDSEDPNEFVLAAVERALAGVRLHPDRDVQHLAVDRAAGLEQLADVAPVHAYEMNGAITGHRRGRRQRAV